MPRRRTDHRSRPRDASASFGLRGQRIRAVPEGLNSWHWFVGDGHVLRRYNPFRSEAAIAYEHAVLDRLAAAGWPVAPPIADASGERIAVVEGCLYSLFPRLRGRKHTSAGAEALRRLGSTLAELHTTTAGMVDLGDRPDWGTCDEYATRPWPPHGSTWAETFPELDLRRPDLATRVRRHHERVTHELADVAGLPKVVVHGDFHGGNILMMRRGLTGLLDFDMTRLDLRASDIATSFGFNRDPAKREAILAGYTRVLDLGDEEVAVLGTLQRARDLEHAAHAMAFWRSGREDMLAQIELAADLLDNS